MFEVVIGWYVLVLAVIVGSVAGIVVMKIRDVRKRRELILRRLKEVTSHG